MLVFAHRITPQEHQVTQAQIAATIAYTAEQFGFTFEQRMRMAEAFATDLRLTGKRRTAFIENCKRESEKAR